MRVSVYTRDNSAFNIRLAPYCLNATLLTNNLCIQSSCFCFREWNRLFSRTTCWHSVNTKYKLDLHLRRELNCWLLVNNCSAAEFLSKITQNNTLHIGYSCFMFYTKHIFVLCLCLHFFFKVNLSFVRARACDFRLRAFVGDCVANCCAPLGRETRALCVVRVLFSAAFTNADCTYTTTRPLPARREL